MCGFALRGQITVSGLWRRPPPAGNLWTQELEEVYLRQPRQSATLKLRENDKAETLVGGPPSGRPKVKRRRKAERLLKQPERLPNTRSP